jgi:hypothetical protein
MNKSSAISVVGPVNLKTGKNSMFGSIFDCWGENEVSLILFKRNPTYFDKDFSPASAWKVVATCATIDQTIKHHPAGTEEIFHGDQSGRTLAGEWITNGVFKHSLTGFAEMKAITGRNSLCFATYK